MFWKIKLLLIKDQNGTISTIRIYAESLKEALGKALDLYRNALILSYQKEGGTEIAYDPDKSLRYQAKMD